MNRVELILGPRASGKTHELIVKLNKLIEESTISQRYAILLPSNYLIKHFTEYCRLIMLPEFNINICGTKLSIIDNKGVRHTVSMLSPDRNGYTFQGVIADHIFIDNLDLVKEIHLPPLDMTITHGMRMSAAALLLIATGMVTNNLTIRKLKIHNTIIPSGLASEIARLKEDDPEKYCREFGTDVFIEFNGEVL